MILHNEDGSNEMTGEALYFRECHGLHEEIPENEAPNLRVWHAGVGTMLVLDRTMSEGIAEDAALILFAPSESGSPERSERNGYGPAWLDADTLPGAESGAEALLRAIFGGEPEPEKIPNDQLEKLMEEIEKKYQARKEAGTLSPAVGDMFQAATALVMLTDPDSVGEIESILARVSEALD